MSIVIQDVPWMAALHTPGRSSRIFSRTHVGWSRNKWPRILSILETFCFEDFFRDVFFSFWWRSMLSSHLSLGLPLGLFPFIFNVITTLSVDSSSLLMTWPNHQLCLYRHLFLFLSHLVTHCIILIMFMSAVVICCSSLFVKVQHSLPKIRIGLTMVWWMICSAFLGAFVSFSSLYIKTHCDYIWQSCSWSLLLMYSVHGWQSCQI